MNGLPGRFQVPSHRATTRSEREAGGNNVHSLWCGLSALALIAVSLPPAKAVEAQHVVVESGDIRIEVLEQGTGPAILILPSLGRGASDYDKVADLLAADGFRVLRPQPRGIGASAGPMTGLTLHEYAADVAVVIEHEVKGPAIVVGHAFGNFVARMLATDRPELVRGVVLAAASPGKVPPGSGPVIAPDVREAIDRSGEVSLPEADRLRYLQLAFFAPGNDPHVWLGGWYPQAHDAETAASSATPVDTWFAAGKAPILDLQAEEDTVAPRKFAGVLKGALGDRVTVVVIPHAGHALAPEQPEAMAAAIAAYARKS
jgi:pimeloyl-ACP methyl ester carboxylesterase